MTHIYVVGDSTTYGCWDSQGGWVTRLNKRFHAGNASGKKYVMVYNLGISGDTTKEQLVRMEREMDVRRDVDDKDCIVILAGGGNDTIYYRAKKKNATPYKQYQKNILRMIGIARKRTNKIIITGIEPSDETKVDPIPWYPIGSYLHRYEKQYNEALKRICKKEKILFLDLHTKLDNAAYLRTVHDGTHPTDKGHAMIESLVWKGLKRKKWV